MTLLFTDLVDSTAMTAAMGREAADDLRQTHFEMLRAAVSSTGGAEVKNLGDGIMAAFTSPSRALVCAVSMQQALDRHNRRAGSRLAIRIGLSTGEVTQENGDFFGEPVVEAARLCGAAQGGQILAAEMVRLIVGRHATQEFISVGPMELKGLPEVVSVVEVRWEPTAESGSAEPAVPMPPQLLNETTSGLFAFFGRAPELEHVAETHKLASAEGRLRAVLIAGEPGMGKTTLAAQAARHARAGGAVVLFGGCEEDLEVPYQPWLGLLGHLLGHAPDSLIAGLSTPHAAALARLLPTASPRLRVEVVPSEDASAERYLLMEAVVSLLSLASVENDAVVVLDDLQWADVASLQLLRHVIGATSPMRVTLLATYRDSEIAHEAALGALLADLWREQRVSRRQLAGLDDREVVDLVEAAAGYQLDDVGVTLAHMVRRETDGNPFFVGELLRHLSESGAIVQSGDGRWSRAEGSDPLTLPSSIRDVVARRVMRLGVDAMPLLSTAAVIGRDFDLDVLTAVSERSEDELLDLLEAAVGAALVLEVDTGRYRFLHALIQRTLYEQLTATRRQRLHLRVAEALESAAATPSELARHWMAATRPNDAVKAVEYATLAGDEALVRLAPVDAASWYRQALELLRAASEGPTPTEAGLLVKLAQAQADLPEAGFWDTAHAAAELARRLDDRDLLIRAALVRGFGEETQMKSDASRLDLIRQALGAVGVADSRDRAMLLAALGEELDPKDWRARRQAGLEARAVARRLADPHTLTDVLVRTWDQTWEPAGTEDRRRDVDELMVLTAEGAPVRRERALFLALNEAWAAADLGAVDRYQQERERLAEVSGLPQLAYQAAIQRGCRLLLAGDLEGAERAAERVLALHTSGSALGAAIYGSQLLSIRRQQGRQAEMVELLEQVSAANPALWVMQVSLMLLYCELGRTDEAGRMFESQWSAGLDLPHDVTWATAVVRYGEIAAYLAHEPAARWVYDQLAPIRDQFVVNVTVVAGAAALTRGVLATLLGMFDEAEFELGQAAEVHERMGAPYWLARTELAQADLALKRGGPASTETVTRWLGSAETAIARYGFHGLDTQAEPIRRWLTSGA